jgi:hypothetical protein
MLPTGIQVPAARFTAAAELAVAAYAENGRVALVLIGERGVEAKATVNLVDVELPAGCVHLKGWSENEGLPEALVAAGAVELTGEVVRTGRVEAQVARLTGRLAEMIPGAESGSASTSRGRHQRVVAVPQQKEEPS